MKQQLKIKILKFNYKLKQFFYEISRYIYIYLVFFFSFPAILGCFFLSFHALFLIFLHNLLWLCPIHPIWNGCYLQLLKIIKCTRTRLKNLSTEICFQKDDDISENICGYLSLYFIMNNFIKELQIAAKITVTSKKLGIIFKTNIRNIMVTFPLQCHAEWTTI